MRSLAPAERCTAEPGPLPIESVAQRIASRLALAAPRAGHGSERTNGRLRALHPHPVEQAAIDCAAGQGCFFSSTSCVYAGALTGEALTNDAPLDVLMRARPERCALRRTLGDARHGAVDLDRLQIPSVDDRRGDRRARGHAAGGAAALQSARKPLHLARHHNAEAQGHRGQTRLNAFATGMNEKQYSITVTSGLINRARRRRDRDLCSGTS